MLKATCQEDASLEILWCCWSDALFSQRCVIPSDSRVPPCDEPEECWALCLTARNGNSERTHTVCNRAGKHHHNFIAQDYIITPELSLFFLSSCYTSPLLSRTTLKAHELASSDHTCTTGIIWHQHFCLGILWMCYLRGLVFSKTDFIKIRLHFHWADCFKFLSS